MFRRVNILWRNAIRPTCCVSIRATFNMRASMRIVLLLVATFLANGASAEAGLSQNGNVGRPHEMKVTVGPHAQDRSERMVALDHQKEDGNGNTAGVVPKAPTKKLLRRGTELGEGAHSLIDAQIVANQSLSMDEIRSLSTREEILAQSVALTNMSSFLERHRASDKNIGGTWLTMVKSPDLFIPDPFTKYSVRFLVANELNITQDSVSVELDKVGAEVYETDRTKRGMIKVKYCAIYPDGEGRNVTEQIHKLSKGAPERISNKLFEILDYLQADYTPEVTFIGAQEGCETLNYQGDATNGVLDSEQPGKQD